LQQLPASAVQLVLHIHHNGVAHDCFVKRLEQ
jgi:ATP-dependent Clp protease adapter protein ClpS